MAAAAGNKSSTSYLVGASPSLFMGAHDFEVEEEFSKVATQHWSEGVWIGKLYHEQREAWVKQIREVQMWRQIRGPAGAVMCETRDLGIKWPLWNT